MKQLLSGLLVLLGGFLGGLLGILLLNNYSSVLDDVIHSKESILSNGIIETLQVRNLEVVNKENKIFATLKAFEGSSASLTFNDRFNGKSLEINGGIISGSGFLKIYNESPLNTVGSDLSAGSLILNSSSPKISLSSAEPNINIDSFEHTINMSDNGIILSADNKIGNHISLRSHKDKNSNFGSEVSISSSLDLSSIETRSFNNLYLNSTSLSTDTRDELPVLNIGRRDLKNQNNDNNSFMLLGVDGLDFFRSDKSRFQISINNETEPSLSLLDKDGSTRLTLGSADLISPTSGTKTTRSPSSIVLFNKKGNVTWSTPE
jgi:hypothetical protein